MNANTSIFALFNIDSEYNEFENVEFAADVQLAIETCRTGDFEYFHIIAEHQFSLCEKGRILEQELLSAAVTEEELDEWMLSFEDFECEEDTDYGEMHPDETIEEFWDHED